MLQKHAVDWMCGLVDGLLDAEKQAGRDEIAFELAAFVRGGDHLDQVLRQRQRRLDVDPDAQDRGGARDRGHGVLIIMGQRTDKARRPPGRAGRGAGQLAFRRSAELRQQRPGDDPRRSARATHRSDRAVHWPKLRRGQRQLVADRDLASPRAELRMSRARQDLQPIRQVRLNRAAGLVASHVARSGTIWRGCARAPAIPPRVAIVATSSPASRNGGATAVR